ncbi:MAG: DNA translocase FtsK [Verrucomicrobia bacterium]|nr:DNA translocase FtsK [Verrucomicrobiota bacterium]
MSRESEHRLHQEVIGLFLLGAGTLLFLALMSYDARDVPSSSWLARYSEHNRHAHNFVGIAGAYIGGILYFLFGAASFLVAAILFGFGTLKLIKPDALLVRRLPWCFLFVISGACLLQLPHSLLHNWPDFMNVRGPGGVVGLWLGKSFFLHTFNKVGSLLLLTGLYVTSLILMTGVHPVIVMHRTLAQIPRLLERYRRWRIARADARERLEMERKRIAAEARKLERQLKRKGVKPLALPEETEPEPTVEVESEVQPVFDPNRPAPKVIDTSASVRRIDSPKKEKDASLELKNPVHLEDYQLPGLELLDEQNPADASAADPDELLRIQELVIETLGQFGIAVAPGDITRGPTITRYEVYPAKGVRVDKIVSLERDIARATRAERINILAPIPGKDTVGIEIANSRKQKVTFRELMESDDWINTKAKIPLVLGKDVYGKAILGDLAQMPHLLVAGTTGSGKSVCINSIIASILYKFKPEELRFIMIDPKVVEMQIYNTLPHLVIPVVTDPKKVLLALRWVIDEMEKRYKIFAKAGVRNITSFNARPKPKSQKELDAEAQPVSANGELAPWESPDGEEPVAFEEEEARPVRVRRDDEIEIPEGAMSYIVVIIDELADLMQTAPADVESAIARITQMARAAGIHMIVATQTPRADVITGVIKANIPSRIAFQVASGLDSRIILDEKGAERLLGQGDMLYQPPGTSRMTRAQGSLVTDEEIHRVVEFVSAQGAPDFDSDIHQRISGEASEAEELSEEDEELVQKCIEIMKQERKASTSLFQRRLRLGYTRAARVVDILEARGYVAAGEGAKPREILVDLDDLL